MVIADTSWVIEETPTKMLDSVRPNTENVVMEKQLEVLFMEDNR